MQNSTQITVGGIIFLIIGVGIGALILIFTTTLGGQTVNLLEEDINEIGVTYVSLESFTASNTTWVQLSGYPIINASWTIYNSTYNDNSTDFNVNETTGKLLTYDDNLNGTTCYATYQHGDATMRSHIWSGIEGVFKGQQTMGKYLPVIVLAVIVVLILSLIIGLGGSFGSRRVETEAI